MKKYLHNVIGNQLNIDFSKKDYDYMYLVYFCTNNFLFANQWTEERKEHIYKIFLSNQKFYDLYIRLSHKYGKFLEQSHIFKTILIYFFKDHLFQLPVIIILLSDLMSEIEMINLFLEKNFSRNRINITPLLLNSYNLEYLNAEKIE